MHLMDAAADPVSDAIIADILSSGVPWASQYDYVNTALNALTTGLDTNVDKMQDYARTSYKLGLPSGESLSGKIVTNAELIPYIKGEIAHPDDILVTEHLYTTFTPGVAILDFLQNTRGYNKNTTEIATFPAGMAFTQYWSEELNQYATKVFVESVTVAADGVSADVEYRMMINRPAAQHFSGSYADIVGSIEDQWIEDAASPYIENVPIPNADPNQIWNREILVAVYYLLDAQGVVSSNQQIWFYHIEDDLYPALHPDHTQHNDEYMPVVPIRFNNVDLTDPTTQNVPEDITNLWSTSKYLLSLVNLDLESLGQRLNANPDIAEMDHAYVTWGVDLQTEFVPSLRYLGDFFDAMFQIQETNELDFLNSLSNPTIEDEPVSRYSFNQYGRLQYLNTEVPENAFKEYGLVLDLQYDYITVDEEVDVIGSIGHATKEIEPYNVTVVDNRYTSEGELGEQTRTVTRYRLIIKTQETESQIRVIKVHNPELRNWIYGRKHVLTTLDMVMADDDEHNFVIPLQYNLTLQYEKQERAVLFANTALLIINSFEKIKLKWYQRGWFKAVIMIVAMIITAWSGQAWLIELAATAGKGIMALILFLGKSALFALAISYAAKFVVQFLGEKFGIIGTIIGIIVSIIAAARGFGYIGQASEFMMTAAQYVIQVSGALIDATKDYMTQKAMKVVNEYDRFVEKLDGLWDELDEINDLLKAKADVDPLTFIRSKALRFIPGETPSVFYTRCLDLVDNTMFTIHDEIPNFFDMRLRHNKDISETFNHLS